MDSRPSSSDNLEKRTNPVSRKVWDLESEQQKVIDIPDAGIDFSLLRQLKNNEMFNGVYSDGSIYGLVYRDGKVYNLGTGLEV